MFGIFTSQASRRQRAAASELVTSALMFVDRDLKVTHVNETTRQMLRTNAAHFRGLYAGFDPEQIVGTCIDVFHQNPSHQRRLLADPTRLPYHTHIQVGPLTFALHVHASHDALGRYVGNILEWADVTELREQKARNEAIDKVQGTIEFNLDGTVLTANANFLNALGYTLDEIKGVHHSQFVDPAYRDSAEYRAFWDKLRRGEYDAGQYKRIGKGGREVWIQASYNPVMNAAGKPAKVIKYATDVTDQVLMNRALDAAVRETQAVVRGAIAGDLTRRIDTHGKAGQIAELSNSVNELIESLMRVVAEIKRAASEVQGGAQEISQGNMNLSQRTEEQASSLEETASSMEEMTSTVKSTADNAAQARQLANVARDQADRGGRVVNAAVAAMSGINSASRKIADIIGVIDEIAFQTNLLALNAAVEAARAGEQGRGFAVVATEVRTLAGRSATAAKEIKALIGDSVAKVEEGSKLVDESGRALGDIGTAVKRVTDVVAEIAQASEEQAAGIEQVNKAVIQMDEMTQQNAALVEEASAASEAIVGQATQLADLVTRYDVGAEPAAAARPARPARTPHAPTPTVAAERRAGRRPWQTRAKAPAAKVADDAPPRKVAAGGGGDGVWNEF